MYCRQCGGKMLGDGFNTVIHCENVDISGKPNEPDGEPIECYINEINPCVKCGSTDIEIYDCGYSSFNYGGGECRKCKNKHSIMVGTFPKRQELIQIWNIGNPSKEEQIQKLVIEINKLQHQLDKLRNGKETSNN